ncbi:MAG: aminotransferase class I/II-fold pyridoxal phosphate-dependent enzyme [Ilumatobacteraceae bacterium]
MTRVSIRDDLRALEGYHSPQVDVAVRLNTNEAPDEPPVEFREAVAAEVARVTWNRYPDRSATALREAIASLHGVDPSMIFAANGSNEVLQTILLTFAGPGRTVATFEPLDLDEVRRVVDSANPSVTFLCSPNNPTGVVDAESDVRAVIDMAPGLVVVDEAYGQFSSWTAQSLVSEDAAVAVVRTFSKTWSMAAGRLGYVIAPAWMVAELDKVVLPYHLDAVKQAAGVLAIEYLDEMNARVERIVAERDRLVAALADLSVDVFPSGANFVLFRPRATSGRTVWQGLLDRGVLVRDCSGWPRLADCLRVTIGTPDENRIFHESLQEVLS